MKVTQPIDPRLDEVIRLLDPPGVSRQQAAFETAKPGAATK